MNNFCKCAVVILAATFSLTSFAKPVLNETTGKEYTSLRDALKRAQSGDVLVINESISTNQTLNPGDRTVTIKGANPEIVLTCEAVNGAGEYTQMVCFDKDANTGVLNIENLTLAGDPEVTLAGNYFLVRNGGTLNMTDVTVTGFRTDAKNGICRVMSLNKGETTAFSAISLTNVKFVDCTTPADADYDVFIANPNTSIALAGDCMLSLSLNNASSVVIEATGLTNSAPIMLWAKQRKDGTDIVKGCADPARFSWQNAPAGFSLVPDGGNLTTAEE